MLRQDSFRILDVDIPADDQGHVIGNIVTMIKLIHFLQGGVFQMFHGTQDGLRSVRMSLVELPVNRIKKNTVAVIHAPVLFFVDRLQFGLKEAEDGLVEALGFELVRVKMMPSEARDGGQALQIMAEDPKTGQLVIEQCAALSRRAFAECCVCRSSPRPGARPVSCATNAPRCVRTI